MCPRSKVQFEEIRAHSEERITSAAIELFANQGYKETTISQIAKSAKVSKGLIYNYFDSKKALLRSIILASIQSGKDLFAHATEDFEYPEEELKHLILDTIKFFKENINLIKLFYQIAFQKNVMEDIKDLAAESKKFSVEKGIVIFTKLGAENPFTSTMLLAATLDGVMLHFLHTKEMNEDYPLDEMGNQIIKMYTDKNSIHRSNASHEK